jgi:cell division protein FtsB
MNVDAGIWTKLNRVVLFLILLAGVLVVALRYLPLIKHNERMRQQILRDDAKIQKAKAVNKDLKASIETLQTDPKAVERLARERLGYAKPDETVVRFETPATNSVTPRQN